jgi:hypothetical protein
LFSKIGILRVWFEMSIHSELLVNTIIFEEQSKAESEWQTKRQRQESRLINFWRSQAGVSFTTSMTRPLLIESHP